MKSYTDLQLERSTIELKYCYWLIDFTNHCVPPAPKTASCLTPRGQTLCDSRVGFSAKNKTRICVTASSESSDRLKWMAEGSKVRVYLEVFPQFCFKFPPLTFGFLLLAGHSVQDPIQSCHLLKGSAEFELLLITPQHTILIVLCKMQKE